MTWTNKSYPNCEYIRLNVKNIYISRPENEKCKVTSASNYFINKTSIYSKQSPALQQ